MTFKYLKITLNNFVYYIMEYTRYNVITQFPCHMYIYIYCGV
jgi:hypothetical protein